MPLPMKARDHHDTVFLDQKENAVGKPAHACTSPVFIDYGEAERLCGNGL